MRLLLLMVALSACNDDDPPADAGSATCEAFCAKSKACDPEALDPSECVEGCGATAVSADCRACVVQNTCEAIAAGACDSSCG